MIIRDLQELRLSFPSHALQSIDPLIGFIDNSEHDFLQDKLGTPLYNKLCEYYESAPVYATVEGSDTSYYTRLLLMSQRAVAFDSFGRAIGVNAVSISNAGVNISVSDDYLKPDKDAIDTFRQTCIKEAHSAVNRLLATLEEWTQQEAAPGEPDADMEEIVGLWKQSRYFYLAADMLIPSAVVLQEYLNIYDSREKFIQLLPDIRYIQEEMLMPGIGEGLTDYIVTQARSIPSGKPTSSVIARTIHAARKFMAAALEERTEILRISSNRKAKVHDEQVRLLQSVKEYIVRNQDYFLGVAETAMKDSPLYVDPEDTRVPYPTFENNECGNSMFVTPPLR